MRLMRPISRQDVKRQGFTLIELLVVISIIALLLSILMPGLGRARESARRIACGASQRNIFNAMTMYLHDNRDYLHPAGNLNRWYDLGRESGNTGRKLTPNDDQAYWGIAFEPYGAEKEVFRCPSKRTSEGWWNAVIPDHDRAFDYSDYGLNMLLVWELPDTYNGPQRLERYANEKIHRFRRPSETIVLHDHYESTIENNSGGDLYSIAAGQDINLLQWRNRKRNNAERDGNAIRECWRHGGYMGIGQGSSSILWLDGHISTLRETTGEDVPYEWYTGGLRW